MARIDSRNITPCGFARTVRPGDAGSANRAPIVAATALIAVIIGVGVVGATGDEEQAAPATPPSQTVEAFTPVPDVATDAPSSTVPPATAAEVAQIPALTQTLSQGMQNNEVLELQERLTDLGFDPGPADGIFGTMTMQAVWAFEKLVLGTPRTEATGRIDQAAWATLMGDVSIAPRRSTNGQADHTEVYLPEQVLIVFQKDVPVLISHISSGELDANGQPAEYCENATYDTDAQGRELDEPVTKAVCALAKTPGGVFTYDRQVEGKRVSPLGGMWNPVYFNYGIAVHGALEVPLEPASHGCVRLPMHISDYYQSLISIGDQIFVWNGVDQPEDVSEQESLPSFDYADPSATTTTTTTTIPPTTTVPESSVPESSVPDSSVTESSITEPSITDASEIIDDEPISSTTTTTAVSTTIPAGTTTAVPTTTIAATSSTTQPAEAAPGDSVTTDPVATDAASSDAPTSDAPGSDTAASGS